MNGVAENSMEQEESQHVSSSFNSSSDLCQQLFDRYSSSSAPQHRHLLATAAVARSILLSEALPLTPVSYFAASISSISNQTLDSEAVSALASFLSILLPLVPPQGISPAKAVEAVGVIVHLLKKESGDGELLVSGASVRALVKCIGVLIEFCDLEDWDSVDLGFQTLLNFSVDKRPKVRKCAQVCVVNVFKLLKSEIVIKEASMVFISLFRTYLSLATLLSTWKKTKNGSNHGVIPEHQEVLHVLNLMQLVLPFLSVKVCSKLLLALRKLLVSHFYELTRHIFQILDSYFQASREGVSTAALEKILISLSSYLSSRNKNPTDTIESAMNLTKAVLDKIHSTDTGSCTRNLPLVIESITGHLMSDAGTALHASKILKDLINNHVDITLLSIDGSEPSEDSVSENNPASRAIKSICSMFEAMLSSRGGSSNEAMLAVISVLFIKLGGLSQIFMNTILLKLAHLMTQGTSTTDHLQTCMGAAIVSMGPEKILTVLPVAVNAREFTCSNVWLIPLLKKYVIGARLGYYLDSIVPLAESFDQHCHEVKSSVTREDLQAHVHGLWELLPAFCRYPTDVYQCIGAFSGFLISLLKKDQSLLKMITISLQELVNQNKIALRSKISNDKSTCGRVGESLLEFKDRPSYSKKSAAKNIRALTSCSKDLLEVLMELFCNSPPENRLYLKNAIGCLASVTDSSITKGIFLSFLERFEVINEEGEFAKLESDTHAMSGKDGDQKGHLMIELASSIVEGANEDLVDLIYGFLSHALQESDVIYHGGAYYTMSKMLQEHSWFCSSRLSQLTDLLLGLKPPSELDSLRCRFSALHDLIVHLLKGSLEEDDTKVFSIINEIILTLKDSREDARKVAYDTLLAMSSSLKDPSCFDLDSPFHKLITMVMGYLSGSSPQIKSGAISALSVLVHQDPNICTSIPDLVPSILSLLQDKALEIIKAALGFIKVLVSCVDVKDLHVLLSDIVIGVLPWSSVSRNHFRSKVIVILEIVVRKCGTAALQSAAPDKYKSFIKTVIENRHGRTSSRETESMQSSRDVPPERQQKRKRVDSDTAFNSNGSSDSRERMKQNKKQHIHGKRAVDNNSEQVKNYPQGSREEKPSFRKRRKAKFGKAGTRSGYRVMEETTRTSPSKLRGKPKTTK